MAGISGGPTERLTERGVRRRQELLDAALRIIVREGPGAVTLRSVVAEAQASHGSVAYYFGTREELINEALTVTATRNIEALAATWQRVGGTGNIDDLAREIARHCVRQMIERQDMGITIVELHLAAARDPALRPAIVAWGRAFERILADTLTALGSSDADWDASVLVSTISGLVMTQLAVPSRHFEDEVLAPAVRQYLHAMASRAG
jgi:DNA-binding transcriptional regulator YbjK